MMEMDQFVVALSGEESEIIERRSRDSAATMKNRRQTILKSELLFKYYWLLLGLCRQADVSGGDWCGFPHHMLVPRSKDYDPNDENLGGQDFVLYAFVTDADDNVRAGSDGIEHM